MNQYDPDAIKRMISEGRARQLDRAVDQIEALTAERDRLRAVVDAAHGVLTGLDWSTGGGKKLVPVTALHALRDALDGTGITGGGGDDAGSTGGMVVAPTGAQDQRHPGGGRPDDRHGDRTGDAVDESSAGGAGDE